MSKRNRWVLLEHKGLPEDPYGHHFDLLLEEEHGCRSWRLDNLLILDGPSQPVIPLPTHRLEWLETMNGKVSGGRGWAKRVFGGLFNGELPIDNAEPVKIELQSKEVSGNLEIHHGVCTFRSL